MEILFLMLMGFQVYGANKNAHASASASGSSAATAVTDETDVKRASSQAFAHQASVLAQARALVGYMTTRQKVGQLLMMPVPISFKNPKLAEHLKTKGVDARLADVDYLKQLFQTHHIGNLLFLFSGTTSEQVTTLQEFQGIYRAQVPLTVAEDLEPGLVGLYGATNKLSDITELPKALTLGAITDEKMIYQAGVLLGKQAKALGVNMILAPVVDVNTNPDNPIIGMRSFGDKPEAVTRQAGALMKGIQDQGIMAVIKHFPGHGDVDTDPHFKYACLSHKRDRLEAVEMAPFKGLIAQGAQGVMTAHLMVPALDDKNMATCSPAVLGELDKMSFSGLRITDGMDMKAIPRDKPGEYELKALLAGHHMICIPYDLPATVERIIKAVESGEFPATELDKKVIEVVAHKLRLGAPNPAPADKVKALIQTPEREKLVGELHACAVTQLKNDHPLPAAMSQVVIFDVGVDASVLAKALQGGSAISIPVYTLEPDKPCPLLQSQGLPSIRSYETVIIALGNLGRSKDNNYGIHPDLLTFFADLRKTKKVILVLFNSPYPLRLFGEEPSIIVAYEDTESAQRAAGKILLGGQAAGKLPVSVSKQFPAGSGL